MYILRKNLRKVVLTLRDNPNIARLKQEELPLKSRVVLNIIENKTKRSNIPGEIGFYIHDVEENRNEDTDTLSINIINEHLGLDIQPSDIDRTHRIGNKHKARKKGRAIIIKFTWYKTRKKVFMNKRKFKETNISVTESLMSLRMAKLKDARDDYGFNKVWTSDGRIMVMKEGSTKPTVIYG